MTFNARIPLAAFRVPDGKIALTLKVHGTRCTTAVIGVSDSDQMLNAFEVGTGIDKADREDWHAHLQIRELLREGLERNEAPDACVAAGLWLALNHPVGGLHARTQVAASMRTQSRAQLTVTSDGCQRWCFVVSDRPAMPEAIMEVTPIGLMVCLTGPEQAGNPADH